MRRALVVLALLLPFAVAAQESQPREWTDCTDDSQCVVVKGICNPVAVRAGYESAAESYFKKRAANLKCPQKFWQPKADGAGAHCRLQRCEIVGKAK